MRSNAVKIKHDTIMKNTMKSGRLHTYQRSSTRPTDGAGLPANPLRPAPAAEQIRQRAYEIHQARGGGPGHELDDWLQAEQELKQARGN